VDWAPDDDVEDDADGEEILPSFAATALDPDDAADILERAARTAAAADVLDGMESPSIVSPLSAAAAAAAAADEPDETAERKPLRRRNRAKTIGSEEVKRVDWAPDDDVEDDADGEEILPSFAATALDPDDAADILERAATAPNPAACATTTDLAPVNRAISHQASTTNANELRRTIPSIDVRSPSAEFDGNEEESPTRARNKKAISFMDDDEAEQEAAAQAPNSDRTAPSVFSLGADDAAPIQRGRSRTVSAIEYAPSAVAIDADDTEGRPVSLIERAALSSASSIDADDLRRTVASVLDNDALSSETTNSDEDSSPTPGLSRGNKMDISFMDQEIDWNDEDDAEEEMADTPARRCAPAFAPDPRLSDLRQTG